MGLCLLLPMICEKGSRTLLEEENFSEKKVSKLSVKRSSTSKKAKTIPKDKHKLEKAKNPPKDEQKSNKPRICLFCHRRVSVTALTVAQNLSVNINFMDEKSGGIYCTCGTSYLRSQNHHESKQYSVRRLSKSEKAKSPPKDKH